MTRKPVIAILKASPWSEYTLFRKHPEYSAIFNVIERHNNLNFVLTGTSVSQTSGYRIKNNIIAWDIPQNGFVRYMSGQLYLLIVFLETMPQLIIPLGLSNVVPSLLYSFVSPKTKVAPVFIGEFDYHGRRPLGKIFNDMLFKVISIVLRFSGRKMRNIFALSAWEREKIEKMSPNLKGQISLVSYPISSSFHSDARKTDHGLKNPDASTILTVAGIEPRKGLDVLVKAISLLPPDERPRVTIKGGVRDSFYMKQLTNLIEKLKLADWIQFDNSTTDYDTLRLYYQTATLFVFPTRDDSLGVVVLEALHSGLPVIATTVGGIPEMIQNGVNGILVEPDNPQELAKVISWLLKDKACRDALAKNGIPTLQSHYYNRITLENALERSVQNF